MSSKLPRGVNRHTDPLLPPKKVAKEETPTDWAKIGAIVAAVIGGLLVALGYACIQGLCPRELLGGTLGIGVTLIAGATILLPAAIVLFDKWKPGYLQSFFS